MSSYISTAANRRKIRALVARGESDAAILRALGAVGSFPALGEILVARRDDPSDPFPSEYAGTAAEYPDPAKVPASLVARLAREYPRLRTFAYPVAFGYAPSAKVAAILVGRSRPAARRYVGRGRRSNANRAALAARAR